MKYRFSVLHNLYHWTLRLSAHPHARIALFTIAFIESSVFLIPPDVMLIPMTLTEPRSWKRLALITTVGSVLGGICGYYIGVALWDTIGRSVVDMYHLETAMESVRMQYEHNAFWAILLAAFTPIPYKVFTIASGLFEVPLWKLIVASILGRGGRFFLVGGLVAVFGEQVKGYIEKYFDMLTLALAVLLVLGFVVVRWIV